MLQNLGDKLKGRRTMALAIIGPLAVIFALWGAYGVVSMSFGAPDYGLKVNDERISLDTLNRAWQERQAQYQQTLNGAEMTEAQKSLLQRQLIDEFVRQTLLRQRTERDGYRATDAQVSEAVRSEAAFQIDGKYDPRAAKNGRASAEKISDPAKTRPGRGESSAAGGAEEANRMAENVSQAIAMSSALNGPHSQIDADTRFALLTISALDFEF